MSIEYAILGLLSWQPLSGYDIKKLFAASEAFYWSGNNNQIYRSLVKLHKDGLVSQEVQHQESLPSRKVYSITEPGRARLKDWVQSAPELPQLKNPFLVQLAWADQLEPKELEALLAEYQAEVHTRLLMAREQARRKEVHPGRTAREAYLWEMIQDNWVAFYQSELDWIDKLRQGLQERSL